MATLNTMYAPQANSPTTTTVGAMTTGTLTVDVLDASILPAAPMLLVFGGESENAETVLVSAIAGNTLTISARAVEGTARAWAEGTTVARLFTAKDLQDVQDNLTILNSDKQEFIGVSGILKGDGDGGVAAAVAGTDYQAPLSASTTSPVMDGTASAGTSTAYSRGDHVHPADTNKQDKITANGILKGDGVGGISAAVAGTDYQAPLTAGTDYVVPATLGNYIPTSDKGANSGVATLDTNGKITADQASARLVAITANTTLAATHANCLLYVTGSRTITIPSNLAAGTEIEIMNYGSGTVTVTAASGVTLNGVSQGSKTIDTQYTSAVLKAITATAWVIQGAIS